MSILALDITFLYTQYTSPFMLCTMYDFAPTFRETGRAFRETGRAFLLRTLSLNSLKASAKTTSHVPCVRNACRASLRLRRTAQAGVFWQKYRVSCDDPGRGLNTLFIPGAVCSMQCGQHALCPVWAACIVCSVCSSSVCSMQ
jgi:hypothetical protein